MALARRVSADQGWQLDQVRFYTGVPDPADNDFWHQFWAFWHQFWSAKLLSISRGGAHVYSRPLRYRNKTVRLPGGSTHAFLVAEEKGIDVRIAIDVMRGAHFSDYDVALIFSQDQDLSEVADEIRVVAREQVRWIKIATAFPDSPTLTNRRGVNRTDWLRIDRATYNACIDPRNYRPTP